MNRRTLLLAAGSLTGAAHLGVSTPARSAALPVPIQITAADGTRLHHREFGQGPTLLFVASWALNGSMWDYQVAHLSRDFRCITFDRRGHGRSDVPGHGYDMDTLAGDLASVIEALDLRNVVLVCHSMGAAEAIRYMARHGAERIKRVIFLAPVAPFILQTPDNPYGAPESYFRATIQRYATDFPQWAADNQAGFFTPETSPALKTHLTNQLLETPVPVAIDCFRALYSTDLRADLARIDRPTLILHGGRDVQAVPAITADRLAPAIANCELRMIPDAPHGIWVTHLAEVNAAIRGFAASAAS